MVKSMTGYGTANGENDDMSVEIEIKTVNSRYPDIQIRMPSYLNFAENNIKRLINNKINRGRIDVFIRVIAKENFKSDIKVDLNLASKMNEALNLIREHINIDKEVELKDILRNEEVLTFEKKELDEESTFELISALLNSSLDKVVSMRLAEGINITEDLKSNLNLLKKHLNNIESEIPNILNENNTRMRENIEKLLDNNIPIDEDRLANELAIYADKSDINEELVRLDSHINQFEETLALNNPIGKKLDFILQEMNREVNTIQSKSNNIGISSDTIESKALIEKLREQVQNVE